MPSTISVQLLDHLSQPAATPSSKLKIGPIAAEGSEGAYYIRMTSLDRDEVYDCGDGLGPQTYYAATGAEFSNLAASNDLTVDNGEAKTLTPVYPGQGITEAMVENGLLDGVRYVVMETNYNDGTMGHRVEASGPIGNVRFTDGGLVTFECLSWSDKLRQNNVCTRWSLTCRCRVFGGDYTDEREPCLYDISGEWIEDCVVTAVGGEPVRDFTAVALAQAADYFTPALVEWTSGDNVGTSKEVEKHEAGGVFTLAFTTRHAIQVGDTFRIRRDCSRYWEGNNSCLTFDNRDNFRGEPKIPVSDTLALTIPGAATGG